jgi:ubiquinone/menaquinone biosynthesis C-methylase UbiE
MSNARKDARPGNHRPDGSGHIRHNRAAWDAASAGYDRRHARVLGGRSATSWGLFRIPESELRLLGPTRGKRVLELGCGAARWSIGLARRGARPTGLDLSSNQLTRARELQRAAGIRFPLVRASAERLPFRSSVFDVVFCDWGAMTFTDPQRSVPECARVLRRGGTLVFATASPFRYLSLDPVKDRQSRRLVRPYFGSSRVEFRPDEPVEFQPRYGVWIELFRTNGLAVERLVETRADPRRRTTYLSRDDAAWGRSWPLEVIWKLLRE